MKAVVITRPGDASVLQVEQVDDPQPEKGEILVRVKAAALNRADIMQRQGLYPPPEGVRTDIPGLEFAGEVIGTGSGVNQVRRGDRVMGLLAGGGYAEKIVTAPGMVMPIPTRLSFEEAASIPEVFLTAYDALFPQLQLSIGETVLIHAVGSGVGVAALQLAKHAGSRVLGTARTKEKLAKAHALGLDVGIDTETQDFEQTVNTETEGRGVDCILDLVGAVYWQKNLNCLAARGRMIVVGLVGGAQASVDLRLLLKKRIRILGTNLRFRSQEEKTALTRSFIRQILALFASGQIKPVVDRVFPFEEVQDAHAYMEANANFGKIVLRVSQ